MLQLVTGAMRRAGEAGDGWYRRWGGLPEQTHREIALFKEILSRIRPAHGRPLRVFEWGAGRSTVYDPRFLARLGQRVEWHAIDNSAHWQAVVMEELHRARLSDCVHVHLREFPAFWEDPHWDRNGWRWRHTPPCSDAIREYVAFPKSLDVRFDLLAVDGRYRKQCLYTAREVVEPDGVVILHDASRPHYHPGLGGFPHARFLPGGRRLGFPVEFVTWVGSPANARLIDEIGTRWGAR
ncbi:MAG: class I SAM-dependent methyltransferase [Armatimonadetes bacterium]|nr:class I SAM-dependent methyltransferase [Armatimonadota bacterium]